VHIRTVRDIGAAVRQARTDRRMTQAELAARIGVARDWVVRLERGHPRLEAQLVLDALEAVGLSLTADSEATTEADSPLPWDDVFAGLTADSPPGTGTSNPRRTDHGDG
jgi:HTH-type transcriptional regulator/antitoxin HipB